MITPGGVSCLQGVVFCFRGAFEVIGTPCPMAFGAVRKGLTPFVQLLRPVFHHCL